VGASSRGEPIPPISPATKRALDKLARTEAGRSWIEKFAKIKKPIDEAEDDITAAFVVGFLRHFVERIDKDEAARHPGG
jgi:hypothetical protein